MNATAPSRLASAWRIYDKHPDSPTIRRGALRIAARESLRVRLAEEAEELDGAVDCVRLRALVFSLIEAYPDENMNRIYARARVSRFVGAALRGQNLERAKALLTKTS